MAKKKTSSRRSRPAPSGSSPARSTRNTPSARKPPRAKAAKPGSAKRQAIKPAPAPPLPAIEFIARGVLIAGSSILLCKNLKHGYYYLPGGHVEFGESAAQALAREFLEEAAIDVTVGPLALISEGMFRTKHRRHHEVNLVFHVEHPPGRDPMSIQSQEPDHLGFEWLDFAALPEADLRPPAAKAFLLSLGSQPPGTIEFIPATQNGQL